MANTRTVQLVGKIFVPNKGGNYWTERLRTVNLDPKKSIEKQVEAARVQWNKELDGAGNDPRLKFVPHISHVLAYAVDEAGKRGKLLVTVSGPAFEVAATNNKKEAA